MRISSRQADILEKIAHQYIQSAKPVSSQLLEKKYRLGICPATIRIEMQKLTDEGYLYQPHTSAGRVPTDRGYRFFVDRLLEKEVADLLDFSQIEDIVQEKNIFQLLSEITKFLSKTSSAFAIVGLLERNFFSKEGWREVLREPEFKDKDLLLSFADLLKNFESEIKGLEINSHTRVFIGQENPFRKAKDFSIVISKCCFPKSEKGIISILGPKRMVYNKNISLINSLKNILEEL